MKKFLAILASIVIVAAAAYVYFHFYFVFGEGGRNGELNYVVHKGLVWKTYEGKLIQAGFRSKNGGGGVQSNEFDFSIVDRDLAQELMKHSGKVVSLRYKQYNGWLPWRGMQRNIVYAIDNVEPRQGYVNNLPANVLEDGGASDLPYQGEK